MNTPLKWQFTTTNIMRQNAFKNSRQVPICINKHKCNYMITDSYKHI